MPATTRFARSPFCARLGNVFLLSMCTLLFLSSAAAECSCATPCMCALEPDTGRCVADCLGTTLNITFPAELHTLRVTKLAGSTAARAVLEAGHATLEVLELGEAPNALSKLGSGALAGFPELKVLRLFDLKLMAIADDAFEGLAKLIEVDLSDNDLPAVPYAALAAAPTITVLTLDANIMTEVDLQALRDALPTIMHLSLQRQTRITRVVRPDTRFLSLLSLRMGLLSLPADEVNLASDLRALLRELYGLYELEMVGIVPSSFDINTLAASNALQRLTVVGASTLAVAAPTYVRAGTFLRCFDWDVIVASNLSHFANGEPGMRFDVPNGSLQCGITFSGQRASVTVENKGFPRISCSCAYEGLAPLDAVSSCPPREAAACDESGSSDATFMPWLMCDGHADCHNAEDEAACDMVLSLDLARVRTLSGESCAYQDWFPEDPECDLDCLAHLHVRVVGGVFHLEPVLADGVTRAGCASGSLCPRGDLIREDSRAINGQLGLTLLQYVFGHKNGLTHTRLEGTTTYTLAVKCLTHCSTPNDFFSSSQPDKHNLGEVRLGRDRSPTRCGCYT